MKRFLLAVSLLASVFFISTAYWYFSSYDVNDPDFKIIPTRSEVIEKLNKHASMAKEYAATKNFNTNICFLIDMNIEAGKNRFFIYDMTNDSIAGAGLVTHGRCNESWLVGRKYGNEVGCGCTSLGKYKIGKRYHGRFGLAYKLYGLDITNSNAFRRYVVLHSHECVPEKEVDPAAICQSDGCPTVSENFLKKIATIVDRSQKPVLLWIYD